MKDADNVYRNLQRHLDKQAVGFPATKSGAEIRILKRIFDPEEAKLAMSLSYQPHSLQEIFETVKPGDMQLADMEKMLDRMVEKGGIGRSLKKTPTIITAYPLSSACMNGNWVNSRPNSWLIPTSTLPVGISDWRC